MHKNLGCLIWKSIGISFNQALEELKYNFKVVDSGIFDKHVKNFVKSEHKPEKMQSRLTNNIVYRLETFNKDRAIPYCGGI